MQKPQKFLSVTLALIIALSTLLVGTSAITVNAVTPSKVTLVSTAYNTNATVTLGWTAASGANGYQIAKRRITDKAYTYITSTGTSYNDKSVITGTVYYYQVRAFRKSGKKITYGAWSNSKSITTLYRPTITGLNDMDTVLNINWNKILGVSHYKLAFKRTIDKSWNYRYVNNTYFNISNPTKGTTYTIQVCPMNGNLAGRWSLVKMIEISKEVAKPVITHTGLNENTGGIRVTWSGASSCDSYAVYYKKTFDKNWSTTIVKGKNYYEIPGVSGNTYYFQVRGISSGIYSRYSNVGSYYYKNETGSDFVDYSAFKGENDITLKVWVPDKAVSLTRQQVEEFKRAYPGKTFKKIDVMPQGESEAGTMLLNDSAKSIDVMFLPSDMLDKLQKGGHLAPVSFADTVSENNEYSAVKAAAINNKLYAYPETNDNGYLLAYDKRVVSAEQAKTLEGVLAACESKGKKFVFDCNNGFYACAFAFTAGIKIDGFERDGYTQKFTQYNEDEAVAALQAFSKLMHDYSGIFTSTDTARISSGFSKGTVGAGVDGAWNVLADKNALGYNFGAAKLPTINVNGVAKQIVPMVGYKCIGVNSESKFPASAQILALYLSGESCQKQRAQQLGWGTTNKNVQTDPVVTNNPALVAMKENSMVCVVRANIAPTFWSPMGNLGNKLLASNTDPSNKTYFKNLITQTIANVRDE